MTNKNSGYKGQDASDAGYFYTPYIPLQFSPVMSKNWEENLHTWANLFYNQSNPSISDTGAELWKMMQKHYPGPYSVVVESEETGPSFRSRYGTSITLSQPRARLNFADPADETWWHLKYD